MKKPRNTSNSKENLEISQQKKYLREEKKPQVENQTLPKEKKKAPHVINKEWHAEHPMPSKATIGQRISWHLEHIKHCKCRDIPAKLKEEIQKRNIQIQE